MHRIRRIPDHAESLLPSLDVALPVGHPVQKSGSPLLTLNHVAAAHLYRFLSLAYLSEPSPSSFPSLLLLS